jgi:hypothetical protein
MDWIEKIFHISPDGGDGSLELGITVAVIVAVAMVLAGGSRLVHHLRRLSPGLSESNREAPPSLDRS